MTRHLLTALTLVACLFSIAPLRAIGAASADKPNIIYIMADDQGWGDLGVYGSPHIQSPNIDKIAAEGVRFTSAYAGSPVCGPTRCTLMTGLHSGHARRRDNATKGLQKTFLPGRPLLPLEPGDVTVAELLQAHGYITAGWGKWGLGNPGTTGEPTRQGFDYWYGYYDQVHAHDFYPDYLIRNGKEVAIPQNANKQRRVYTHDLINDDMLKYVRDHKDEPMFLYLAFTPPHSEYVVPEDDVYPNPDWSKTHRHYAGMITRMDRGIGQLMALLKELDIDDNTIVFYTSDHGANPQFNQAPLFSNGPFRGHKRYVTEGGLRVPMVVRWPGKIQPGAVTDFPWSFYDFLPTALDIAGAPPAKKTDGLSILPTLLGEQQKPHDFFYWEFYSPFQQAVRIGNLKGIRYGTKEALELYDITKDLHEDHDIAAMHPKVVKQMEAVMAREHVDTPYWPVVEKKPQGRKKK